MNNDISEIVPHVFISNWYTSNNPEIIKKYKIKGVITIETRPKPKEIIDYYKNNNIKFMYIHLPDFEKADISKFFNSSYNFMNNITNRHENVLVHCYAGISRSSTIILNYMIRKLFENNINMKRENIDNILNYVLYVAKSQRRIINPNQGFINQLKHKILEYKS